MCLFYIKTLQWLFSSSETLTLGTPLKVRDLLPFEMLWSIPFGDDLIGQKDIGPSAGLLCC